LTDFDSIQNFLYRNQPCACLQRPLFSVRSLAKTSLC